MFSTCTNYDSDTKELIIPHYSMNIVTKIDNIIYFIGQRADVYELVRIPMIKQLFINLKRMKLLIMHNFMAIIKNGLFCHSFLIK